MEQKFSFSISNIEGPPGAFECIQQSHSQMNILGALQYKMRIQAKDDVYDSTRESMAKAAETQKQKWWVLAWRFICGVIAPSWNSFSVYNAVNHILEP